MSKLIAGIGMSHSSLVVTPDAPTWRRHETVDRSNPYLRDKRGAAVAYADLEQTNGDQHADQASLSHLGEQVAAMQAAIAELRDRVTALALDVLVVFGDDQLELHSFENMPALAVYYGDELVMGTNLRFATYQLELGAGSRLMEGYAMDAPHVFPGHAAMATHLIASLLDQGFDVGAMSGVHADAGSGVGHAFGIVETQLMREPGAIPLVPVYVNTYWPPNQVPIPRCWDLGLAVRRAIDAFPGDARVGVLASGGLSHFSTDEELDRRVLEACRARDEATLRSLPAELLNGGTSEIRNWVAVAAACGDLAMDWSEYLPVYRTPVGTGVGLAFALWS